MNGKTTSVVAREDNGNIQITFTIPFSEIETKKEDIVKELAKSVEVPGFRKGLAPLEKVRAKIPQDIIIERTLSLILPEALAEVIKKEKLQIAIYPKFELISAKEGSPWQIRGVTCELPQVELGDYKKTVSGALRAGKLWTPGKNKGEEVKETSKEQKEQLVIKTLLDSVKANIPQILIDEEVSSRLSNLLSRLEKLGLALESYLTSIGKKPEDIRTEYAKQAKDAILVDLILNKVVEEENIKIDSEEVEKALRISGTDGKKDDAPEEVENKKRFLESVLKRRLALDLLINLN